MFTKTISMAVLAIAICMGSASVLLPETAVAGPSKVDICHLPPGNPENFHTIRISLNALPAHLSHLDLEDACNGACATLCDDGDACTIDDTGDCEENGCPVDRQPTDCSDGNLCTIDSCDSESGCANPPVVCDDPPSLCHVGACNPGDGNCVYTQKVCDPGFLCDETDGLCKAVEPEFCPCFDQVLLDGEGGIPLCWDGNFPTNQFPNAVVGNLASNPGFLGVCAGEGCTNMIPGDQSCFFFGTAGTSTNGGLTAEEASACRNLILNNCNSQQAPAAASSSSDTGDSEESSVPISEMREL